MARVDPMKLLAGGASSDEYDHEVSQLAPRVSRATSRTEVEAAVSAVFDAAFGAGSVPSAARHQLVVGLLPLSSIEPSDAV